MDVYTPQFHWWLVLNHNNYFTVGVDEEDVEVVLLYRERSKVFKLKWFPIPSRRYSAQVFLPTCHFWTLSKQGHKSVTCRQSLFFSSPRSMTQILLLTPSKRKKIKWNKKIKAEINLLFIAVALNIPCIKLILVDLSVTTDLKFLAFILWQASIANVVPSGPKLSR